MHSSTEISGYMSQICGFPFLEFRLFLAHQWGRRTPPQTPSDSPFLLLETVLPGLLWLGTLRLEDHLVVLLRFVSYPWGLPAMPTPFVVSSVVAPRPTPPATVSVVGSLEQVHIGLGLVPVMLGLAWAPVRLLESSTGIRCRACGRREAISAGGVVVLLLAAVLPWAV